LEGLVVDGKIILNESSRSGVEEFTGLFWLRIGTSGGLWERDNEPSVFIQSGELLDQLLRKDSAP
jgi:hypothetical protein